VTALDIAHFIGEPAREEARSVGRDGIRWNLGAHISHWSPSSLAMARRCPYQFQQRYIRGLKERPGEAPVTGTAVHTALERNFEQKIASREDLPLSELIEWYWDIGWPTTVQIEQARAEDEVSWDEGSGPDFARERGRAMLTAYHSGVAPRIQPLAVEGLFETDLFNLPVPVIGRFDIERETSVIDVKTGKQKRSTPKEDWRLQAGIYGEVRGKGVEFHSVTMTKAGTVNVVTPLEAEAMLVHPSFAQRQRMREDIRAISFEVCLYMELYGPDEPWPQHGRLHSWACSYCGWRSSCPAWAE